MKEILVLIYFSVIIGLKVSAQIQLNFDPDLQSKTNIHYFKPAEIDLFVGDCIPFSHGGVFYLYWLIDKGHHSLLDGLGGHQWVLSKSTDLINWEHFPIVLGIEEEWEKSICTGSVIYANNKFYAFYATRVLQDGKRMEQLSYAISDDGTKFIKQKPNPFLTAPPGYNPSQFRDPKIISTKDGFHMFISSYSSDPELQKFGGCLAHLFSTDLKNWELKEPVLTGQTGTPECPDYFFWNGWYYLIYSSGGTYYVKSKNPFGPWEYPEFQPLKEPFANVPKTAEFKDGRRISAAWIPSREDNKDNGRSRFGGNIVMRELVQEKDGTLGTRFVPELIQTTSEAGWISLMHDKTTSSGSLEKLQINSPDGIGFASIDSVPYNCRITLEMESIGNNEEYGLFIRSNAKAAGGYRLAFSPNRQMVQLGNVSIDAVQGLRSNFFVEIIMSGDIIDVCIGSRRCIVNRCPEQKGNKIWFYVKQGRVNFKGIKVFELN